MSLIHVNIDKSFQKDLEIETYIFEAIDNIYINNSIKKLVLIINGKYQSLNTQLKKPMESAVRLL